MGTRVPVAFPVVPPGPAACLAGPTIPVHFPFRVPHLAGGGPVMSRNLHALIAVAAEMRAVGHPWDVVAAKVNRKADTWQKWPTRYAAQWEPLYRAAQLKRFDQIHNEANTHLQNLMRSKDDKVRERATHVYMRCAAAAFAKHRDILAAAAPPAATA